jgi:hypothetical protein
MTEPPWQRQTNPPRTAQAMQGCLSVERIAVQGTLQRIRAMRTC